MTRFRGYAAIFDAADRSGDVVRRGAFAGAGDVPLLWQHRGHPVGTIERLEEDARGLRVVERVDDPALARLVTTRAVDALSFGYRATDVRRGWRRELLRVELIEVSLVARPMQPLARIDTVE